MNIFFFINLVCLNFLKMFPESVVNDVLWLFSNCLSHSCIICLFILAGVLTEQRVVRKYHSAH